MKITIIYFIILFTLISCNSSDAPIIPSGKSDTVTYTDVYGYTWSCPNNETSVDDCARLEFECGQICDPLSGFDVIDVENSGTCESLSVNALRESGTCIFNDLNFSCNVSGQIVISGPGVNIQAGAYTADQTKFYCQNNPNDISSSFPSEVNLIFD